MIFEETYGQPIASRIAALGRELAFASALRHHRDGRAFCIRKIAEGYFCAFSSTQTFICDAEGLAQLLAEKLAIGAVTGHLPPHLRDGAEAYEKLALALASAPAAPALSPDISALLAGI